MICVASVCFILGLELVVPSYQVLCCQPIVKFVSFAVATEGNCDADSEKNSNDDNVDSELSL